MGTQKIKYFEIREIMKGEDNGRFIKAQKLGWFNHIRREENGAFINLVIHWKLAGNRLRGTSKLKRETQLYENLRSMGTIAIGVRSKNPVPFFIKFQKVLCRHLMPSILRNYDVFCNLKKPFDTTKTLHFS